MVFKTVLKDFFIIKEPNVVYEIHLLHYFQCPMLYKSKQMLRGIRVFDLLKERGLQRGRKDFHRGLPLCTRLYVVCGVSSPRWLVDEWRESDRPPLGFDDLVCHNPALPQLGGVSSHFRDHPILMQANN